MAVRRRHPRRRFAGQQPDDTLSGGDWLCDQDAVLSFVEPCKQEMVQLEHGGCRWSHKVDGSINVRFFGGLKVQRTWFAADKSGLHMPYMMFKILLRYSEIQRFDESFVAELKRGVARHAVRAASPDGAAGHGNLDHAIILGALPVCQRHGACHGDAARGACRGVHRARHQHAAIRAAVVPDARADGHRQALRHVAQPGVLRLGLPAVGRLVVTGRRVRADLPARVPACGRALGDVHRN